MPTPDSEKYAYVKCAQKKKKNVCTCCKLHKRRLTVYV